MSNTISREIAMLFKEKFKEQTGIDLNIDIDEKSGLTPQELLCMDKICEAYSEFLKLETQHPSEINDFVNAIHILQGILAMRVVRREHDRYWLIHKSK